MAAPSKSGDVAANDNPGPGETASGIPPGLVAAVSSAWSFTASGPGPIAEPLHRLTTALAERYRVEHKLSEGGMATVYLGEDLEHGRRVALKVLHPELAAVLGGERYRPK